MVDRVARPLGWDVAGPQNHVTNVGPTPFLNCRNGHYSPYFWGSGTRFRTPGCEVPQAPILSRTPYAQEHISYIIEWTWVIISYKRDPYVHPSCSLGKAHIDTRTCIEPIEATEKATLDANQRPHKGSLIVQGLGLWGLGLRVQSYTYPKPVK